MSSDYIPIKTGFRGKTLKIPADNIPQENTHVKSRRFCIGGRGREWGPECFKVLEEMSKRKDAQIFMQPVDAIKHPAYYTLVKDPIDLSKIQLKFHGGMYQSMFSFVDDVHLMFTNHLLLYDDPTDPVHQDIKKLKDWFDGEMDAIRKKWFFLGMTSGSKGTNRSASLPREVGDRIDAIEAENKTIIGAPLIAALSSNLNKVKPRLIIKDSFSQARPIAKGASKGSPLVFAKIPLRKAAGESSSNDPKPLYAIQLTKTTPGQKIIISPPVNSQSPDRTLNSQKRILLIPKSPPNGNKSYTSLHRTNLGNQDDGGMTSACGVARNGKEQDPMKAAEENAENQNTLVISNSNMWFGVTQVTPTRPIVVHDQGVLIDFKLAVSSSRRNKGGKQGSEESLRFAIRPDDLVKCYVYVGNPQKHTIFLMVLPNCVRRLKLLLQEKLAKQPEESLSRLFIDSCLITIFTPAMTRLQVSQLMYFMWSIGKSSIFGSNLYAEINQKAALNLLSNVKPNLINLQNLENDTSTNPGVQMDDRSKVLSEIENSREHVDCFGDLEKPDAENLVEDRLDANRSDEPSDTGSTASEHHLTSENIELEEISLDDIHLKEEPTDDGFPTEILHMDNSKEGLMFVFDENVREEQRAVVKPRHKPGILSKRSSKRKSSSVPSADRPSSLKKGKVVELEKLATESNSASHSSDILIREHENEGDVVMEIDNAYTDNKSKDLEIILPKDSDSEISDLEIKFLDQTEDGELIWMGRKVNMRCPITQRFMKEPLRNRLCGHTYDKIGVEQLIKNRGAKARCPVPGCRNVRHLELSQLEPDETVRHILDK